MRAKKAAERCVVRKAGEANAVMIVLSGRVGSVLGGIARKYGIPIFMAPTARLVLPSVLRTKARVLIVQLEWPVDEPLELIRKVRRGWRRLITVAVAADADEGLERAARQASVDCYVTLSGHTEYVESVIGQFCNVDGAPKTRGNTCRSWRLGGPTFNAGISESDRAKY